MTKVTDHAIIPTGIQNNLQYNQQQVYDSNEAFYCRFYDDCLVANTTVLGSS
jgi:DNA topoisomerase-3